MLEGTDGVEKEITFEMGQAHWYQEYHLQVAYLLLIFVAILAYWLLIFIPNPGNMAKKLEAIQCYF